MKDASREHIAAEVLELGALTVVSDGSLLCNTTDLFSVLAELLKELHYVVFCKEGFKHIDGKGSSG